MSHLFIKNYRNYKIKTIISTFVQSSLHIEFEFSCYHEHKDIAHIFDYLRNMLIKLRVLHIII